MRKNWSKYNSVDWKNIKVTYLLGAGASFNSVPIWKGQGKSMKHVADYILGYISDNSLLQDERLRMLHNNPVLISLMNSIRNYGELALEYGSIDIFAKRLFLLGSNDELKDLKYHLSIYFDLWENFVSVKKLKEKDTRYSKIDKRYLSLLSVLLEKGLDQSKPSLNKNISFITWNYDLQLEMAYESFTGFKAGSLDDIDEGINYMGRNSKKKDIIHLNGFRGNFKCEGKYHDNVANLVHGTIDNYLLGIITEMDSFRTKDYTNCIKYSWEQDYKTIEDALSIMEATNILVVIGYSFPSFNRQMDSRLINAFQENNDYLDIIFQDPNANQDIINVLFNKPEDVKIKKNPSQFYIPHEFLFPNNSIKDDYFISN